jgi:hypothetical protein
MTKAAKDGAAVRRRDLLRVLGLGAGTVVTASTALIEEAAADSESNDDKRRARYQANSPDVQAFYRVNRFPPK